MTSLLQNKEKLKEKKNRQPNNSTRHGEQIYLMKTR